MLLCPNQELVNKRNEGLFWDLNEGPLAAMRWNCTAREALNAVVTVTSALLQIELMHFGSYSTHRMLQSLHYSLLHVLKMAATHILQSFEVSIVHVLKIHAKHLRDGLPP